MRFVRILPLIIGVLLLFFWLGQSSLHNVQPEHPPAVEVPALAQPEGPAEIPDLEHPESPAEIPDLGQPESPAEIPADEIHVSQLPEEGRHTLALIKQNGPYPYSKDGTTFGNREGLLPSQPRGYYREYTVPTPGAGNRGARRIVAGRDGDYWYTDNHYQSFRRIRE